MKEYYEHYILYLEAMWLLLQSTPTFQDINKAETLLQHFCFKFATYYGKTMACMHAVIIYLVIASGQQYYTANVHLLLHFADCVRYLGPLWAHSAFENLNGWLMGLFHGTKYPEKQIIH